MHKMSKQTSRRGLLSCKMDHWLQLHWSGTYVERSGTTRNLQLLDKTDIESVGSRDQIQIRNRCALIRALERCDGVTIDVYLPPQVKTLIVHKFGWTETYCYFRNFGANVYPGKDCEKDPFYY